MWRPADVQRWAQLVAGLSRVDAERLDMSGCNLLHWGTRELLTALRAWDLGPQVIARLFFSIKVKDWGKASHWSCHVGMLSLCLHPAVADIDALACRPLLMSRRGPTPMSDAGLVLLLGRQSPQTSPSSSRSQASSFLKHLRLSSERPLLELGSASGLLPCLWHSTA
jgi:hypothetical protein